MNRPIDAFYRPTATFLAAFLRLCSGRFMVGNRGARAKAAGATNWGGRASRMAGMRGRKRHAKKKRMKTRKRGTCSALSVPVTGAAAHLASGKRCRHVAPPGPWRLAARQNAGSTWYQARVARHTRSGKLQVFTPQNAACADGDNAKHYL